MKRSINGRAINPVGLGCMNICWAYGPAVADDYAKLLLNTVAGPRYTKGMQAAIDTEEFA